MSSPAPATAAAAAVDEQRWRALLLHAARQVLDRRDAAGKLRRTSAAQRALDLVAHELLSEAERAERVHREVHQSLKRLRTEAQTYMPSANAQLLLQAAACAMRCETQPLEGEHQCVLGHAPTQQALRVRLFGNRSPEDDRPGRSDTSWVVDAAWLPWVQHALLALNVFEWLLGEVDRLLPVECLQVDAAQLAQLAQATQAAAQRWEQARTATLSMLEETIEA